MSTIVTRVTAKGLLVVSLRGRTIHATLSGAPLADVRLSILPTPVTTAGIT